MMTPPIYLDSAATTPLRPEAAEVMLPWLQEGFGNPSSLYAPGKVAKKAVDEARLSLATGLGTLPECLFLTSGATESNNWVIKSVAFHRRRVENRCHLITSQIEHSAVLDVFSWLESEGFRVTRLPVTAEGMVRPDDLAQALTPETALVSIMHGNNEMGAVQDIAALGQLAQAAGALFHTDAVQTLGKLPLAFDTMPVDFISGTAHKFGGPKGIGFLLAKSQAQNALEPLLHGGGQENGYRSGTENVAGIVGMAKAFELTLAEQTRVIPEERRLQSLLMRAIEARFPTAVLNGPADLSRRVPGNVNFSFPPLEGEALVLRLDAKGFAVSSGSACHSASLEGSHVIGALGVSEAVAKSSLRVSIGRDTTEAELSQFIEALSAIVSRMGLDVRDVAHASSEEGVLCG